MGMSASEDAWMLAADSRVLPLARLLHYARREALALGLTRTANSLDQALSALICPTAAADPPHAKH